MVTQIVATALTTVALSIPGVGPQVSDQEKVGAAIRDTGSFILGEPSIGTALSVTGGVARGDGS